MAQKMLQYIIIVCVVVAFIKQNEILLSTTVTTTITPGTVATVPVTTVLRSTVIATTAAITVPIPAPRTTFVDFPIVVKPIPKEEWKRLDNTKCITATTTHSYNDTIPEWQYRAPYALIIGSMKAGTSALKAYIDQHPHVLKTKVKELHFYDFDFESFATEEGILRLQAQKGYRKKFIGRGLIDALKTNEHHIVIDDSPRYIFESHIIPARVNCVSPWVKIIATLRNPIDRAFSQYNMLQTVADVRQKVYNITFEDWILKDIQDLKRTGVLPKEGTVSSFVNDAKDSQMMMEIEASWKEYTRLGTHAPIGRGLYAIQLQQWMNTFKGDILVLQNEQMERDPDQVYKRILNFLHLSDEPLKNIMKKVNKGNYKSRVLNPATRKMLEKLYDPYNQDLYRLLDGDEWIGAWDPM